MSVRDALVSVSGALMGVMCMGECEWCRSESVSVVRVSVGECTVSMSGALVSVKCMSECEWCISECEL